MANSVFRVLDVPGHGRALTDAFTRIWRYRVLTLEMTRRELVDRYAGSTLGAVWTFVSPLLISGSNLMAYLFIFRIRLSSTESSAAYAAFVLSAMSVWMAMSDALGRASAVIPNHGNLVKQIVFPSEILPLKLALASLPTLLISSLLVICIALFDRGATLLGMFILFPLSIAFYVVFVGGCCYLLAAIGVFFRDLKDIVAVLLSIGLFLHPIFYPPEAVPEWLNRIFHASPVTYILWCFRDALYYGHITQPLAWVVAPIVSALMLAIGWRTFRALSPTFGNAL